MTEKDYFGKSEQIDHNVIEDALSCGAVVRYRKCEEGLVGRGSCAKWGVNRTEWKPLKSVDALKSLEEEMWDRLGWKWVELSYHLTDSQHLLIEARDRQRDEEARRYLKAEYEAYLEREQKRIDELLKKKPWLEEPHTDEAESAREALEEWYEIHQNPNYRR